MSGGRGPLDGFFGAVRFLTIVPAPSPLAGPTFGAAAFPAVGFLIGVALVVADDLLGFLPFEIRNVALVALLAVLTGGLQHDGLADMLDALGGGEPAERLRIMADPSIGTYGVLGLVLGVATKISSLMLLGDPARFSALLLAPMLGRTAMVLGAWRAPAARPGGLGAAFGAALGPQDVLVASGFAFVAAVGVAGWLGAAAIVVAGVIVAALRAGTTRCFGGITGDVLGAISEVVETLLLAFFAATRPGS